MPIVNKLLALSVLVFAAGITCGQPYPSRPVRIVTSAAGGGGDFTARLIAPELTGALGQQVIVDNRGTSFGPGEIVANAAPDGYNLLCYGSLLWLMPLLQNNVPFDPVRDFAPVTLISSSPNVLVVHPSVAAKSVKELITLARNRPGELNYASSATGSTSHLAAELFRSMAGINIVRVPYKGSGQAVIGVVSGEVQMMLPSPGGVAALVKSGKLRALAITSAQPSPLFPGLPTVSATGLPGYETVQLTGLFVRAGTPAPVINRLNREVVRILGGKNMQDRFLSSGAEVVGSTPDKFSETIKSEIFRMGKIIKEAGIRSE